MHRRVDLGGVDVTAAHLDPALDAHPDRIVMHPVEAFQRRGLTTARWAYEGQDL